MQLVYVDVKMDIVSQLQHIGPTNWLIYYKNNSVIKHIFVMGSNSFLMKDEKGRCWSAALHRIKKLL